MQACFFFFLESLSRLFFSFHIHILWCVSLVGVSKLGLECKMSDHSVESGEFLVLVLYTKKDRQQNKKTETPATSSVPVDDICLL